jgi:hypothetical protein
VAKNVYQEMKKKYGDMVQLDTSNYRCIVWFFWGSAWRNTQCIIDQIRSKKEVKDVSI